MPRRKQKQTLCLAVAAVLCAPLLPAQTASIPANTASPRDADVPLAVQENRKVTPKQLREADDAYIKGANALTRKDFTEAESQFTNAVRLNPQSRDYALALAVTREHRLTDLVQHAATARELGHVAEADRLLLEARDIDPQNAIVRQHFSADGEPAPAPVLLDAAAGAANKRAEDAGTLAGAIQLKPDTSLHTFHLHATAQTLLQQVYQAYGIKVHFAEGVDNGRVIRLDLENVAWADAFRVASFLTNTFAAPVQSDAMLVAANTPDNRAQYLPLMEETLYMPGTSAASLTEFANMARTVFDLRVVNAVSNSGSLVLRGDENSLSRVNATFADLVEGNADVLLDVTLYEVDRTHIVAVGAQLPASVGVFPIASTAQSLISANQSLISQAVANNLITLTGNAYTDALTELEFLLASGTVSSTEFTNLLGVFGHYAGLPLAGVFLGSTSTLNASLNSSEVRILDAVQLRIGDKQDGLFRSGTRYPIETGIYNSSLPSSLSTAVAGLSINGSSVSSLLSQYLGASNVSVPQVQYEDLGLTLKAKPQVLSSGEVTVNLDFKVEALGSGSLNSLPILNNRQFTSTITIPTGRSAMLISQLSQSEARSISGLPFLSEIPGFQSTYKNTEKDTDELLVVVTPHIVRNRNFQVTSRRLLLANQPNGSGAGQ